ncbi:MAG: PorP/SprF family type IX secretion system membrane protein [Saprospiraceae bacterium]
MKKYAVAFTTLLVIISTGAQAQDAHFSQFFAAPQMLNPALTGALDGRYRVNAIYRDQWRRSLEDPIKTFGLGADLRFNSPLDRAVKKDAVGLGLTFFNDKVAVIDFSTTQIGISLAYHKALGLNAKQFLSAGFQAGLTQRNITYEALNFQDEFNGFNGFTLPTGEELPANNFSYGDYNIGLAYTSIFENGGAFYGGVAMHHILRPVVSFYENDDEGDRLFSRYSLQLAASIPLDRGNRNSLHPRLLAQNQGSHVEINTGLNWRAALGQYGEQALHLGAWVRPVRAIDGFVVDAVIPMVGIELGSFLIGLSYDLNLNTLTNRRRRSAFELSFTFLGEYDNDSILCPKF